MSEQRDPERLIDDTDDPVGELVRAARRDVPDDVRVDAMLESVLREVGGGGDGGGGDGGPAGHDGGAAGDGGAGAAGGAAGGAATAGAKAGGAWFATGAGKLGAALAVAAVGAGATVWALRSGDAPEVAAPSTSVLVAESSSTGGGVGASSPTSVPAQADTVKADTLSTATSAAASAPQATPSAARAAPAASTTASAIASATASASSEPADPRAELALLTEARAALSSSPARALSLAEEHARRFPSSQLGQERSALRIQALAALGRTTGARAELDAFRAQSPRSAYLPTLEALLAR